MTGTNCDMFTHNQSRSYLNHLVVICSVHRFACRELNNTYALTMRVLKFKFKYFYPQVSLCITNCCTLLMRRSKFSK
jgi:hypothetical protein